jgi:hypothetical protein
MALAFLVSLHVSALFLLCSRVVSPMITISVLLLTVGAWQASA